VSTTPYAELHSHTNFSFLDGASSADDLVERAVELGLRAIGGDLAADGSIGARTAALAEPYVDGDDRGATYYHDTIPPNPDLATRAESIGERIIGGTVVYKTNRLELLGELFNIYHDDHTSDQVFDSLGWYAQAAYVVKNLTPYYRFDVLNFGGADPYYSPNVLDVDKHTLGVRWDFLPWNALKVEYAFANYQDVDDAHLFSANLSFAF